MAPEYLLTGEYSDKSDVYSFGIIIFELVSGQKNRVLYQATHMEDMPNHVCTTYPNANILILSS